MSSAGISPPSSRARCLIAPSSAPNSAGRTGKTVCIVAVRGTAVGAPLLRRVIAAAFRRCASGGDLQNDLRRRWAQQSTPRTCRPATGLEVRSYVHELHRELAACDVAVIQGGLTTSMELVGAGRPFVSIPLARHFEQQLHVRHRLERWGARTSIDTPTRRLTASPRRWRERWPRLSDCRQIPPGGAGRASNSSDHLDLLWRFTAWVRLRSTHKDGGHGSERHGP